MYIHTILLFRLVALLAFKLSWVDSRLPASSMTELTHLGATVAGCITEATSNERLSSTSSRLQDGMACLRCRLATIRQITRIV
ncbi:hypothetical protein CPB84DRAFT_1175122 [Gymnopilus junonius]|uniref:Secreted protein n=1 Tax=Gymnopilus junonius TaxID=109634 RepID=A0A9P5NNY8_GYMJU|nr:hypothetical protein CPB84DRAFT_1175122 [Gymnopilus junonius]